MHTSEPLPHRGARQNPIDNTGHMPRKSMQAPCHALMRRPRFSLRYVVAHAKQRWIAGYQVSDAARNTTSALATALIDGPKLVRQGKVALWCALIWAALAWGLSWVVWASAASTTS